MESCCQARIAFSGVSFAAPPFPLARNCQRKRTGISPAEGFYSKIWRAFVWFIREGNTNESTRCTEVTISNFPSPLSSSFAHPEAQNPQFAG